MGHYELFASLDKMKLIYSLSAIVAVVSADGHEALTEKQLKKQAKNEANSDGPYDLENWGLDNKNYEIGDSLLSASMNQVFTDNPVYSMFFENGPFISILDKNGLPIGTGIISPELQSSAGAWMEDDRWAMGMKTPFGYGYASFDGRVYDEEINVPDLVSAKTKYETYHTITSGEEKCKKFNKKGNKCLKSTFKPHTKLDVDVEGTLTHEMSHSMQAMGGETAMIWNFVEYGKVVSMPEKASRKKRQSDEKTEKKNKKEKTEKEAERMLYDVEGVEFMPTRFTENMMMKSSPEHMNMAINFELDAPIMMLSDMPVKIISMMRVDHAPFIGNEDNFEKLEKGKISPSDFENHWGMAIQHEFEVENWEEDIDADTCSASMSLKNQYGDEWKKGKMEKDNIKNPTILFEMDMNMSMSGKSSCHKMMTVMHFYVQKMMSSWMMPEMNDMDMNVGLDMSMDVTDMEMTSDEQFYYQLMTLNDTQIMDLVRAMPNCEFNLSFDNIKIPEMPTVNSWSMAEVFDFKNKQYTYNEKLNGVDQMKITHSVEETEIFMNFDMYQVGEPRGMEKFASIDHNKLMKIPYMVMKMAMSEYYLMKMHSDVAMHWNETMEGQTEQNWALLLAGVINQDHFQNLQYEETAKMVEAWGEKYCPMHWRAAFEDIGVSIPEFSTFDNWHYQSFAEQFNTTDRQSIDAISVTYCEQMISDAAAAVRSAKMNYMEIPREQMNMVLPMMRELVRVMEAAASDNWYAEELPKIQTEIEAFRKNFDCEYALGWVEYHNDMDVQVREVVESLTANDITTKCTQEQRDLSGLFN